MQLPGETSLEIRGIQVDTDGKLFLLPAVRVSKTEQSARQVVAYAS